MERETEREREIDIHTHAQTDRRLARLLSYYVTVWGNWYNRIITSLIE